MKRWPLALLLLTFGGCVRFSHHADSTENRTAHRHSGPNAEAWAGEDRLDLTYRVEGQTGILDSDHVTLRFPDLPLGTLRSFSFQQGRLSIQVGGEGTSDSTVNCSHNQDHSMFHSHYDNGTNTIQFCGREVRLINQACQIVMGAQSVDASSGKKEISIH